MKRLVLTASICFFLFLCATSLQAYEAFRGPSEVIYWDKTKAYEGYTMFGSGVLIDMEGNFINKWPGLGYILENGNVAARTTEYDWDGNVVWRWDEKRENYHPHHDSVKAYNPKHSTPTYIMIMNKDLTHEQAIAAGADPKNANKGKGGRFEGCQMDAMVEVDMNGNIVWEWWFFDHIVQDRFPSKNNYVGRGKTLADYPGKLDINWGYQLDRDWMHCNSIDYNPELDQVVINSVHGEFFVIDHGATFVPGDPKKSIELAASDAGDFLYRWGDPAKYGQGEKPYFNEDWLHIDTGTRQIGACHDIQWIKPGNPGAGNFLIFNNADQVYQSSVQSELIEINPFLDANGRNTGQYVNPPDAGYDRVRADYKNTHQHPRLLSKQIVWSWKPAGTSGFFSNHGSGTMRLPNGNTLGCGQAEGHLIEVTPEGEIVWEYINPITASGVKKIITGADYNRNGSFRAMRYGPDYPGFKGKNMTPKGKITEIAEKNPSMFQGRRRGGGGKNKGRDKGGKKGGKK